MIQGERLADEADVGAKNTEEHLMEALARQRAASVSHEEPDEDAQGNRYCLDCADIIPPERVHSALAFACSAACSV